MPNNIIQLPYTSEEILSLLAAAKDGTVSMPSNNSQIIPINANTTSSPTCQTFVAPANGWYSVAVILKQYGWLELIIDNVVFDGTYRNDGSISYSQKVCIPARKGQTISVWSENVQEIQKSLFTSAGI